MIHQLNPQHISQLKSLPPKFVPTDSILKQQYHFLARLFISVSSAQTSARDEEILITFGAGVDFAKNSTFEIHIHILRGSLVRK
jgi:hypothetical protein